MATGRVRKILGFATLVEVATGVAFAVAPAFATVVLFGAHSPGQDTPLGRAAGVGILALGLACWPDRTEPDASAAAVRAMLTYNSLIAVYLVHLATTGVAGVLLWPAVLEHAAVTALLVVAWRNERRLEEPIA